MGCNRGGADIEGDAIGLVMETGPGGDDLCPVGGRMDANGDGPFSIPQRLLQILNGSQIALQIGKAPLGLNASYTRSRSPRGLCISGSSTSI